MPPAYCSRHGLHCIVPPYLFEQLCETRREPRRVDSAARAREDADTRTEPWVEKTRQQSDALRALRIGFDPVMVSQFPGITASTGSAVKSREIYDAQSQGIAGLPGKLVRTEGSGPSPDLSVNEAYDHSGITHDFFSQRFRRNSLDDRGLTLMSSVHVGQNLNNAFWTGQQMAYGDGDGKLFSRFTRSLDVVAHELTHGVISYTANLVYENESGALNEHFADVLGMLTRQWHEGQDARGADWLVGKDIMGPQAQARSLRTFKAEKAFENDPWFGTDPQPKRLRDQYRGGNDNGGVHLNSGIPNHAFYRFATALGGNAWDRAGGVWYESLLILPMEAQFTDMVLATEKTAVEQHGFNSEVHRALMRAWADVGF
jgi:Zn-dependent metalloprotease